MILAYDEELWEELVDNVQTTTYSLEVGESISFPVHGSDEV